MITWYEITSNHPFSAREPKKAFEREFESQTLVLMEVFSLLEMCWGYNKVMCMQSRRFLEDAEYHFFIQDEPTENDTVGCENWVWMWQLT